MMITIIKNNKHDNCYDDYKRDYDKDNARDDDKTSTSIKTIKNKSYNNTNKNIVTNCRTFLGQLFPIPIGHLSMRSFAHDGHFPGR